MLTLIIFLAVLSVLVIAHEWGHFIVARKSGMKVYEFGLGFPPRLGGVYKNPKTGKWRWVWGNGKSSLKQTAGGEKREQEYPTTLYSFNWLPLGGFVKIKGENGEARNEKDSFMYHSLWKRALVLVAGVTMNFILAALLLAGGLMIGLPTDISGGVDDSAVIVEGPFVMIQQVQVDTPADKAGIQYGDKVLAINGMVIKDMAEMVGYINEHTEASSDTIELEILRGKEKISYSIAPAMIKGESVPKLGVILGNAGIVRYPWHLAIVKGFMGAGIMLVNIFIGFFLLIKNLIVGQGLLFEVAGPVGIANVIGASAKLGISYLIHISAVISLSLAALNILPIPALDGGRLLFVIIEKITKKPVPMKYEQTAHMIGFVLLMILIIVVTWRDVVKLI